MPNIISHYLMAEGVRQRISPALQTVITNHHEAFILGTLGPDFLYYYRPFPWHNTIEAEYIHALGDKMHDEKINEWFSALFKKAKEDSQEGVISYICGFLCHFAMDATSHPYVFYQTQNPNDMNDLYEHRFMESRIDGLLLQVLQKSGQIDSRFKPYQLVHFQDEQAKLLQDIYQPLVSEVYQIDLSDKIFSTALKDCYHLQRLLNDPHRLKEKLTTWLEKRYQVQSEARSIIIPYRHYYDEHDLLNLNHQVWKHPVTGEESTDSFIDLFFQSIDEGSDLINQFERYLNDDETLHKVIQKINNRSFNTGTQSGKEMTYFKRKEDKESKK